jgi:transcriptional regulator with PAS, ATPase and Fis domain
MQRSEIKLWVSIFSSYQNCDTLVVIMDIIESFNNTREEYEKALSVFGRAMLLVNRANNIVFINQEARDIVSSGEAGDSLIGKKWTDIVEAASFETGGEVKDDVRPSSEAIMAAQTKSQIFFISPTYTTKKTLVTLTATPLILGGEIAGGIIILKLMETDPQTSGTAQTQETQQVSI